MSKKNKKGAWRKKHEEAVRLEKLRTQELKKKKRKKRNVIVNYSGRQRLW